MMSVTILPSILATYIFNLHFLPPGVWDFYYSDFEKLIYPVIPLALFPQASATWVDQRLQLEANVIIHAP